MLTVKLVNMPFAALNTPSIALSQLKGIVTKKMGDRVDLEQLYLNHEFGTYLGSDAFSFIANSGEGHSSGFGEWYFRQAAFPHLQDNAKQYFDRYSTHFGPDHMALYERILKRKRETLEPFLDQLIDQYELDSADVVGFTSMFFQTIPSAALARMIKARNPNVLTVIGGANCEAPMGVELAREMDQFDFVFSGFGLVSFPSFLEKVLAGKTQECHQINGIFSKANSGDESLTGVQGDMRAFLPEQKHRPIGDELDINSEVIPLDYDNFLESYEEHFVYSNVKPYLFFETSRGCWWGQRSHCTFCGLNGGSMVYRAMKPELAVAMLTDLFDRYGDEVSHFSGVDNILPKEYLEHMLPKLEVPEHVSMFYEVKADMSEEQMKVLADAHVFEIQPGIESMATSTLKLMRKGTTAFNNINFLKYSVLYGIYPAWNLLIGFPGETGVTYEKYLSDLHLLTHLPPPDDAFPVRFDRFSPYFMKKDHYQLDLHPLAWYSLAFPFKEEVLKNLAFYFEDRNYGAEYVKHVSRYVKALKDKVAVWKKIWLDAHEKKAHQPELYFKDRDYSNNIHDSRDGEARELSISQEAKAVLLACPRPKTPMRIVGETELSEDEVKKGIDEAMDKGLVYSEGKSIMNIVFDHAPVYTKAKFFHAISN